MLLLIKKQNKLLTNILEANQYCPDIIQHAWFVTLLNRSRGRRIIRLSELAILGIEFP